MAKDNAREARVQSGERRYRVNPNLEPLFVEEGVQSVRSPKGLANADARLRWLGFEVTDADNVITYRFQHPKYIVLADPRSAMKIGVYIFGEGEDARRSFCEISLTTSKEEFASELSKAVSHMEPHDHDEDRDPRVAVVAAMLNGPGANLTAEQIIEALDQRALVTKWDKPRVDVLEAAECRWIPRSDLLAHLNALPGAPLTMADLKARMANVRGWAHYPTPFEEGDPALQADCLRVYHREKKAGTEIMAIFRAINEEVLEPDAEREDEKRRERRAEQRQDLIRSGKDFGPMRNFDDTPNLYMRQAGQLYRLEPGRNQWAVFRVNAIGDHGEATTPPVVHRQGRQRESLVSEMIKAGRLK